ncbi:ATP-binding protein [Ignavibacterium album]|uniref:DNA polymerase III subunit n=1 Tax=Ignavibacterium album TaxID=591197 RepID=UPI0035BA4367
MINPIENIIGQEKVKLTLQKIITSGKISHAFLFRGYEGVGKEDAAIKFAQAIVFNSKLSDEKKQLYISQIGKLTEPFIKYIFPLPRGKNETDDDRPYEKLKEEELDLIQEELNKKSLNHFYKIQIPKANFIKINSIREINHFVSLSYEESLKRIILISDAHLMNEPSQNALLKNLEEPPPNIIFILSTNYPERLKSTVISRCWNITFQPLNNYEVAKVLHEKFDIDSALADKIAVLSNGSVTQALKIINYGLEELKDKTIKVLRYSFGKKYYSAFKEFENFSKESDTEYFELIISLLIHWLNDFYKYRTNSGELIFKDYIETFEKFYLRYPNIDLLPLANRLDEISSRLKNNINLNLAISNIISEISSVIPAK